MKVPNREAETLMKAIDTLWVGIHGAPKELIMDGESGIVLSHVTRTYLHRKGIKLHPRGKDQHARYIERRGALPRDTIHRVEAQFACTWGDVQCPDHMHFSVHAIHQGVGGTCPN